MNVFTKVRVVLEAIRTGTVLATVLVFTAALIIWLQKQNLKIKVDSKLLQVKALDLSK